jgi:flagellar assembly protein FliH
MEPIIRTPEISAVKRRLGRLRDVSPAVVETPESAKPRIEEDRTVETEFESLMHMQELAAEVNARTEHELRVEQEIAEARIQAERRGYADGQEKAEEAARKAVSEQLERFNSIMASLYQSRRSVLDGAEETMIEIAYAAVCRIVGEAATTREAVVGMISQTLSSLQQSDELIVRLHPQDLALVRNSNIESLHDSRWQLRADSSIEIGGCIVDGASGSLDARLEVQLAKLRETLVTIRQNRENPEEVI